MAKLALLHTLSVAACMMKGQSILQEPKTWNGGNGELQAALHLKLPKDDGWDDGTGEVGNDGHD